MRTTHILPLMLVGAMLAFGCSGNPAVSPTGATCGGQPAGGTFQAGANLGGYFGNQLPSSFQSLTTEAQVDAAITRASTTSDWTCFQTFYGGAVKKWRENTSR